MRRIIIALAAMLAASASLAQEITTYQVDSTAIYNALYNPGACSQAPLREECRPNKPSRVSTTVDMGFCAGGFGTSEYVSPRVSIQASDRLSLSLGMGMAFSNLSLRDFSSEVSLKNNIRAVSNYYTAAASYNVSPRCDVYGSIIYARCFADKTSPSKFSKDSYMASFGSVFKITESLSIGVELRSSRNMSPFSMHGCTPWGW